MLTLALCVGSAPVEAADSQAPDATLLTRPASSPPLTGGGPVPGGPGAMPAPDRPRQPETAPVTGAPPPVRPPRSSGSLLGR
ncbi:MAG TPA: hypothetical protein ENK12_03370, partial [Gammaproteobacteria bacterium]|nr:hypothetical protein [Gammaproteobacteria bacterium]